MGMDVTVMGAGIFGLSVAWACARRGARVRLCERRRVGAGASGGLVGALAPHVPEGWSPIKAFQLAALQMAPEFWAGVAAAGGGDPGYARTGRVQPLADAAAVARATARSEGAARHWGAAFRWATLPAAAAPGLAVSSPSGQVLHDTLSARLHPRRAAAALAAALRARGATLEEGCTQPPAASGAVVWATGWEGLATTGLGGAVKGQALRLAMAAPEAPMVCDSGLFVVPHDDGTVAVGSTREGRFDDPQGTDAQLAAVHARAVALCPALTDAPVLERWAGLRPRAADGRPLLGAWPQAWPQPGPPAPRAFIANGGFAIGFALAPLVGEGLADLVLEDRNTLPAAFAPDAPDRPPPAAPQPA